ncbi:large ribosomal subunit protein uL10m-like [Lineus longissimus]|uniref:large ribosomal subunit protein uL10m-like n=1 Tax=Lineus longissimus TaxID=88925 RepID=UPI002B4D4B71
MAAPMRIFASRNGNLFSPCGISVRHRNKVYVQKPRPRIIQRRILEEISLPILLPPFKHPAENCGALRELKKDNEENRYKSFLLKQCRKGFEDNSMLIVMQKLPMSGVKLFQIRVELFKKGIAYQHFENEIFQETVRGTKWEVLRPLFVGDNLYAVSPDDKVKDLVKVIKKFPQAMILGGVVENRVMTREALLQYAAMPSLDHARGQLVAILGSAAAKTSSLLSSQQQTLSNNLTQYVKQTHDGTE